MNDPFEAAERLAGIAPTEPPEPEPQPMGARQARRWKKRKGYDRESLHDYRPSKHMLAYFKEKDRA